jgi:tetratricopeptide (TPR) repeat protein
MRRAAPQWAAALFLLFTLAGCFLDPSIERERIRRQAFDSYTEGLEREGKGQYTEALDLYMKAIAESPRAAFLYHAGLCHARLGHDDQALFYLDQALALQPDYPLARAERDLIVQRQALAARPASEINATPARTDEAAGSAPKDSPDPTDPTDHTETAPATAATGSASATGSAPATGSPTATGSPADSPAVVPAPAAARAPTPEQAREVVFPELFGGIGESDGLTPATAEEIRTKSLFHFPPSEDEQARLALQAGRLEQAAFYLEQEVKSRPDDWELRLRLARVLARSGRISRSGVELREAARLAPERSEVWYEWGGYYIHQENWVEAERCYRECLRIEPDHIRARNNLGVVLLKMNLWEQAEEQLQILVANHPDFASPYLNLAIIESQYRKDVDKAVGHAEDYVRYQGARTAEVRQWRQNLLLRKGTLPPPETP